MNRILPQNDFATDDLSNVLATPKSAGKKTREYNMVHSTVHYNMIHTNAGRFKNSFYSSELPSFILLLLSSRTFSGFKSLCIILFWWQLYTASHISCNICSITVSLIDLCFLFLVTHWRRLPPSQYSITMNSCFDNGIWIVSNIFTTCLSSILAWIWTCWNH